MKRALILSSCLLAAPLVAVTASCGGQVAPTPGGSSSSSGSGSGSGGAVVSSSGSVSSSGGGSGSSSGTTTSAGTGCYAVMGGTPLCYVYSSLSPSEVSALDSECTQNEMGKIVDACPSGGEVGCCTYVEGAGSTQYSVDVCYYDCPTGSAAPYQQACTGGNGGKWTPGSAGCTSVDGG